MNWYIIQTKDMYVSKLCIFYIFLIFKIFKTFVGRFLIGENISIWMSTFRFESSRGRDGGMSWIIFGRSFVGVQGFFFHESYCDESIIITIYVFLNIQIFCDVSSGVGLYPYMGNGCVYALIWFPLPSLAFWVE